MLLADDVLKRVTQALHSDGFRNIGTDTEPIEFGDPVARLTEPLDVDNLLPNAVTGEQDSAIDTMTSTRQEREIAEETYAKQTPGSSASFQSAQAATMPAPKNWFKKWGGGPNGDLSGFIPTNVLTKIEGGNHFMRRDAAQAWKAMNRAARRDGVDITITDSYRDYDTQVRLKEEKRGLAATPGHSNHGWGLANDVNVSDPRVYKWLKTNAKRFGFEQPMDYEPWHWEYGGGFHAVAKTTPEPIIRGGRRPADPLNKVTSSLVTAPMVFGSIVGEVNEPKVKQPGRPSTTGGQGLGFVPAKLRKILVEAADRYGLSARFLGILAKHESGFDTNAVSSAGAQGWFQVMPLHGLGDKAFNPKANAMKAAEIFSNYLDLAKGNLRLALAFWNAGPNADRSLIEERMRLFADPILQELRGGN